VAFYEGIYDRYMIPVVAACELLLDSPWNDRPVQKEPA